jgi:hypothetical protein
MTIDLAIWARRQVRRGNAVRYSSRGTMSTHDDHEHDDSPDAPPGYYEIMETAVRELLVEERLIGSEEIRRQIEVLDSRTPALGGPKTDFSETVALVI